MERPPHDPTGGEQPELRIAPETEESTDERAIREGIEAALHEHRDIDNRTARYIASQLHEGQASALYSLASTGNIDERVHDELTRDFDQQPDQVKNWINWLGTYCLNRPDKGPVPGWSGATATLDRTDDEQAARAELAQRISNAAVTTLGAIATISTLDRTHGGPEDTDDGPRAYPWDDHARWRPQRQPGQPSDDEIDELFAEPPDEEVGTVEDIGWHGLLRHVGRPGGTIISQNSDGIRTAHQYDTPDALDTAWEQLQQEHDAFMEATRVYNHEPGDRDADPEEDGSSGGHQPQIWVGSLIDYNNGRLHGVWLDATLDPDELRQAIAFMLRNSLTGDAEEYAIMDYDAFAGLDLGEHEPLETISKIANGIVEHGEPYAHWAAHVGTDNLPALDRFEDHYHGRFNSTKAYAEYILEETEAHRHFEHIPDDLRDYATFDTEAMAADMEHHLHVTEAAGGGVHIFDPTT